MSQQINLFNPLFLKTKKVFSAVSLFQIFGFLLLGAMAVSSYVTYQSAGLVKNAALISAQLHTAEMQLANLHSTTLNRVASKSLEASLKNLEADIKDRQKTAVTLQKDDFGNTKGYSNYLVAFARQIPNGVWLTGFDIKGGDSDISLQGRTFKPELVPNYVSQLKREAVMQGKSFASLQMQSPQLLGAQGAAGGAAKADEAKQPARPGYIEFELSSSPMSESASAAGANGK